MSGHDALAPQQRIGDHQTPMRGGMLAPLVPPAVRRASVIFDPTLAGWFVRAALAADIAAWRHAAAGWAWLVPPPAAREVPLAQRCPPLAEFLGAAWPITAAQGRIPAVDGTIVWPVVAPWRGAAWLAPGTVPGADVAVLEHATPTLLGILGSQPVAAYLTRLADRCAREPGDPAIVAQLPLPGAASEHEAVVAHSATQLVAVTEARAQRADDGLRRIMRDYAPPGATADAALRDWWRHDVAVLLAAMRQRLGGAVPERFVAGFAAWHATEATALAHLERERAALEAALDAAVLAWYGDDVLA